VNGCQNPRKDGGMYCDVGVDTLTNLTERKLTLCEIA
jgi:hypothetical protein